MVAGQVSLINVEPNEETVPVFSVAVFDGFNPQTKLHDIALLQVKILIIRTFHSNKTKIILENIVFTDVLFLLLLPNSFRKS